MIYDIWLTRFGEVRASSVPGTICLTLPWYAGTNTRNGHHGTVYCSPKMRQQPMKDSSTWKR